MNEEVTNEVVRELSLEKEIELYTKEANELFRTETEGCEQPFANCIVRRGNRIIKKAMQNIAVQRVELDRLKKQLDDKCDKCIVRDRAEAIKEFADRLKNLWYDNRYDSPNIEFDYFVDNLVKEMTQEG